MSRLKHKRKNIENGKVYNWPKNVKHFKTNIYIFFKSTYRELLSKFIMLQIKKSRGSVLAMDGLKLLTYYWIFQTKDAS